MLSLFTEHCEAGGGGNLRVCEPGKEGKRTVILSLDISFGGKRTENARCKKKPPNRIRRDRERRQAWLDRRAVMKSSEGKADRPSVIVSQGDPGAAEIGELGEENVAEPAAETKQEETVLEIQNMEEKEDPGHDLGENMDSLIECPIKVNLVYFC